jgi:hypothetical protein
MRVRALTIVAALVALALIPSTALAAPKKVFFKFSAGNYSVAESAGHFDLTVQRSGNTSAAASVDVSVSGGTATNGSQYSFASPQTVNFAARETSKKLSVTLNDNSTLNGNKTVTFGLTNPTSPTATAQTKAPASANLAIIDDEGPGQLDFSSSAYTVLESGGFATVTVNRVGASNIAVSVDYMTQTAASSPATPTADYTPIPAVPVHTLTFAPGEGSKTFQVQITDDSNAESPENVNLVLFHPQNLSGGSAPVVGANSPAVLTINDDDVPTFSFQSTLFSVGESAGNATITVNRGGATNVPASVNYSTSDGTATAGSDYTATSGTLNFAAGETQKTFPVAILSDTTDEPNETVDLALSNGATSELSIADDDNPTESVQFSDTTYSVNEADGTATITVQLSHALGTQTTVHYATSDGTATDGSDYSGQSGTLTFDPGQTSKTFDVPILNPVTPDPEDNETINLTLTTPGTNLMLGDPSTATLTVVDDDPPGLLDFKSLSYSATEAGLVATITVERTGGVGGPVAVDYTTSDGTATAGSDYTTTSGTLTWASGDSADKTFMVPIAWDGRGEGPETINLALSNADGADLGANTAAVIHVADDGASGPLQLTSTTYSVNEGDGLATITVTRSGGSLGGPVTVDYATADGSALAGSDYDATSGTLTFGPGEASKSFTVPITSDSANEDAETFQVMLSNANGGASLGSPAGATVTIADDDPPAPTPQDNGTPSNLQSSPANPNPAGSQTAAKDTRAPKLTLSARKIQKAFKAKLLALTAKCDENCAITVTAKIGKGKKTITLGKASKKSARGINAKIKLKLSKKVLAKLAKTLKRGKVTVTVTVVARDRAGNQAKASRPITVRH